MKAGLPLCLIGDSGTGKSHLMIGIGTAIAGAGMRVRYTTTANLVNELAEAADEKKLGRTLARYGRVDHSVSCVSTRRSRETGAGSGFVGDIPTAVTSYETIGATYSGTRRPDPRIAAQIHAALGDIATVINVGAGTGSYEPPQTLLAVEPGATMIAQRPTGSARALQASAESIPIADDFADAAMAILTVHHWTDLEVPVSGNYGGSPGSVYRLLIADL
ncbi:ATP-binding protein [Streptomyces sp. NPDC021098]|uniref:ATP-binding protein n=1 Tax=unclassified Streptomyces TaxID=2593676 RepID=UPI0037B4F06A